MCTALGDVRSVPIADIAVPDLDRDQQRLSLALLSLVLFLGRSIYRREQRIVFEAKSMQSSRSFSLNGFMR